MNVKCRIRVNIGEFSVFYISIEIPRRAKTAGLHRRPARRILMSAIRQRMFSIPLLRSAGSTLLLAQLLFKLIEFLQHLVKLLLDPLMLLCKVAVLFKHHVMAGNV